MDEEFEEDVAEEDDIIMFDNDNGETRRTIRKRNDLDEVLKKREQKGASKAGEGGEDGDDIDDINNLNAEDAAEIEAIAAGQRRSLRTRKAPAAKPTPAADLAFEGDVDIYGAEDADEYGLDKKGKRRSTRQTALAGKDDFGDLSGEERYGLRGRKKRVKLEGKGAADYGGDISGRNFATQQSGNFDKDLSLNHLTSTRGHGGSSMYQFIGKRNEKNGIVCAYCLHPETKEAPCNLFCQSYCQRSFHENCKDALYPPVTFAEPQPDESPTAKQKAQSKA